MPGGRPTKLNDEMREKALYYVENYDKEPFNHAMPSIVGMAVVLNVAKSTLYKWAEDKDEEFSDTLDKCLEHQEFTLFDKGLKNDVNSAIAKLALGNFGHHDKSDNTLSGPNGKPLEVRALELALNEVDAESTD